jgi:uncharacterized protein
VNGARPDPVPMFPLGSVVFPFTAVPLRVFEPRYQALLDRVLEGDRRFGSVLIERGLEVGGGDARFSVGTMVRVADVAQLPEGHRAIVVAGMERIRVIEWLPDDPHPWAVVEGFADTPQEVMPEDLAGASASLRRVLALASELGADVTGLSTDVASDSLVASYQISALAPVTPLDAQHLLEAPGPVDRLRAATRALDERAEVLLAELGGGG